MWCLARRSGSHLPRCWSFRCRRQNRGLPIRWLCSKRSHCHNQRTTTLRGKQGRELGETWSGSCCLHTQRDGGKCGSVQGGFPLSTIPTLPKENSRSPRTNHAAWYPKAKSGCQAIRGFRRFRLAANLARTSRAALAASRVAKGWGLPLATRTGRVSLPTSACQPGARPCGLSTASPG